MKNVSTTFMMLGILFCVCLITSNLLEVKVIQIADVNITGGLLVFPVMYIINDCITEIWGYKKAMLLIWCSFVMSAFVLFFTTIAVFLPDAPFWDGALHFNYVFGLVPRIMIASLCAFLFGSVVNSFVMSKMKVIQSGKRLSVRAIVSSLIGETTDSIIFFPIAFGGLMGWRELFEIALLQIFLKSLYEILALPVTIRMIRRIKRAEGVDVYDNGISYNIFKIKEN